MSQHGLAVIRHIDQTVTVAHAGAVAKHEAARTPKQRKQALKRLHRFLDLVGRAHAGQAIL